MPVMECRASAAASLRCEGAARARRSPAAVAAVRRFSTTVRRVPFATALRAAPVLSAGTVGAAARRDPTNATFGSEARFSASVWAPGSAGFSGSGAVAASGAACGFASAAAASPAGPAAGGASAFARSGAMRGTRTSTLFPEARTSKSASPASSITTRAVFCPAAAAATRRMVPSPTVTSRGATERSVSAKSTTTRGGSRSLRVVKESGRSPINSTDAVAASPPAWTPTRCPRSCATAAQTVADTAAKASAPRSTMEDGRVNSLTRPDGSTRAPVAEANYRRSPGIATCG